MKNNALIAIVVIALLWIFSFLISTLFNYSFGGDKIVVIPIKGVISTEDSSGIVSAKTVSSTEIVDFIKQADSDDSVKGIILEINSPGGTVVASKEIADAVKGVNKPVIAWIREIGASGAYWVASSSDTIVVDPLSITGSIGVISSYLEFSELLQDYGINYERLVAGEFKDTGTPFKRLDKEERALLQGKLNSIHNMFITEVAKNRNLEEKDVRGLANGIFYLGEEAVRLGLADSLGGKELAINLTKDAAGITKAKIITYREKRLLLDFFNRLSANSFYNIGRGMASEVYIKRNYLEIVS